MPWLLIFLLIPIAVGMLLRRVPPRQARNIILLSEIPAVLAIGWLCHAPGIAIFPGAVWGEALFAAITIVFAGFAVRQSPPWPFISFNLILLAGFSTLLAAHTHSNVALVLLANLPAVLLAVLRKSAHRFGDADARINPAAWPSLLLAIISVAAASQVAPAAATNVAPAPVHAPPSFFAMWMAAIMVLTLIWQLLLSVELASSLPAGHPYAGKPGLEADQRMMVTYLQLASQAAILAALYRLNAATHSVALVHNTVWLMAGGMLVVGMSMLLMERAIPTMIRLMEIIWIAIWLLESVAGNVAGAAVLSTGFMALLILMAAGRLLNITLSPHPNRPMDMDDLSELSRQRPAAILGLFLVVLGFQMIPVMPGFRFIKPIIESPLRQHILILALVLSACGVMVVTSFRIFAAMHRASPTEKLPMPNADNPHEIEITPNG